MTTILVDPEVEQALQSFLTGLPPQEARRLEVLAHAWATVGGALRVGDRTVRLMVQEEPPRTAATLHADLRGAGAALEIGRVVLEQEGLSSTGWEDWCDERPELAAHGFSPKVKYPVVQVGNLSEPAVLRLAMGLRDLRLAVRPTPARDASGQEA